MFVIQMIQEAIFNLLIFNYMLCYKCWQVVHTQQDLITYWARQEYNHTFVREGLKNGGCEWG